MKGRKVTFGFSRQEVKELLIAAVVLGFIVGYPFPGADGLMGVVIETFYLTLIVGIAFIAHEVFHKLVAQSHGLWSEFRMWKEGLGLSLLAKVIFGTTLIVPGAAYYSPYFQDIWGRVYRIGEASEGRISAAGPLANIVLAVLIHLFSSSLGPLAEPAIFINLMLALFNLIPFPPLDGYKIMRWNFWIWVGMVASAWILFQNLL